ncbi:gamma tubulin interacting protein [Volvox carteri f. nagariensis]|uniref:Gamma-tubulin complex component n=1 Tax=Volvox carteri f. nagariensis TaxID=3068 RepID=D8U4A5_VOLCA|nr:gamma tubulin interacting protein [Volvox carteri f. nagariensis]EFJ45468.1 gamma tubulin interacting protein [Volvox carteri f. nagariensis]|eukprot:XP_002953495.1 gamma tubulin interacting protein [Volvox carteri f. nagariensis]
MVMYCPDWKDDLLGLGAISSLRGAKQEREAAATQPDPMQSDVMDSVVRRVSRHLEAPRPVVVSAPAVRRPGYPRPHLAPFLPRLPGTQGPAAQAQSQPLHWQKEQPRQAASSQPGQPPASSQPWNTAQVQTPPPANYTTATANPFFGTQEISLSPLALAKRESYTAAMTDTMAAAARLKQQQPQSHQRVSGMTTSGPRGTATSIGSAGTSSYGHPTPAVAQPGDLFSPNAVAVALARRPTELVYLCDMPQWTYQRPSLSGLDLIVAAGSGAPTMSGGVAVPDPADVTPQELMLSERALVSDLLQAFLGFNSQLIRPRLVPPVGAAATAATGPCLTFVVREDLVHETLRERVAPLLPICDYVAALQRFVETRSAHCYGMVTHALAAALRGYLEDWQVMVAMMENQLLHGALDLTRLTFYCQQPTAALAVLADVAAQAANVERTSAGLLNLLHARYSVCAGNGPGRSLLHHLLTAAAAPYCACLERWLRHGVLDDPYHEFMVQEDPALRCDSPAAGSSHSGAASRASSYWRGRYTLRYVLQSETRTAMELGMSTPGPNAAAANASGPASVPPSLDVPTFMFPYRELILRTGKYQNVLRECGQPVAQPVIPQSNNAAAVGAPAAPLPPLSYDPAQPGGLQLHVRAAHAAASTALLGFLLRGGGAGGRAGGAGLIAVLRSIKHFFLLDQGDVLVSIMEVADEELCKPAKAINRTRLQSLLEMGVKMSSAASDPHADTLGFEMDPRSLESLAKAAALVTAGLDASRAASFAGAVGSPVGTPGPHGTGGRPLPMQRTPGGSRLLGPRDQDLPGWELFLPTLKLDWPATLVVGGEELLQYQLLFKHLWGLKRAERQLEATWLMLQGTKRVERMGTPTEGVQQRAADVDQVIEMHRDFLRRAAGGLLLDQPRALRCLITLQQSAAGFTRHISALWERLQAGIETSSNATQVSAADIAAEQQRAAQVGTALDDLQRLMGEATGQIQALVAAVRDHYEGLMTGNTAMAGTLSTGGSLQGGGLLAESTESGGWDLEALQNLADRLDFGRPAAGTLGAVLAEMTGRH